MSVPPATAAQPSPGSEPAAGRGRRRGGPDTRGAILEAARESFAAKGYRGTTMRGVAATAGVDAALVHHYFGTKDDLFIASLEIPVDPRVVLARVVGAGLDGAGPRLLEAVLTVWDEPEGRRTLVAVVRSSLSEPGSTLLRDGLLRVVLRGLAEALPPDEADIRVQLVATQMLGLIVARYVLLLEPLASLPRDAVVAAIGPTLQRYLQESLPPQADQT